MPAPYLMTFGWTTAPGTAQITEPVQYPPPSDPPQTGSAVTLAPDGLSITVNTSGTYSLTLGFNGNGDPWSAEGYASAYIRLNADAVGPLYFFAPAMVHPSRTGGYSITLPLAAGDILAVVMEAEYPNTDRPVTIASYISICGPL